MNCHLIKPCLAALKSDLRTPYQKVDLTLKSSFNHSLKIKIATVIKTKDVRSHGSTTYKAAM